MPRASFDNAAVASFLSVGAWNDLAPCSDYELHAHAARLGLGALNLPHAHNVTSLHRGPRCSASRCTSTASAPATMPGQKRARAEPSEKREKRARSDAAVAAYLSVGEWNYLSAPSDADLHAAAQMIFSAAPMTSFSYPSVRVAWDDLKAMKEQRPPSALYEGEAFGSVSSDCISGLSTSPLKGEAL